MNIRMKRSQSGSSKKSSSLAIIILCPTLILFLLIASNPSRYESVDISTYLSPSSAQATSFGINQNGCKRQGLPQPMEKIPLPPTAYEFSADSTSYNFVMAALDNKHIPLPKSEVENNPERKQNYFEIVLAIPRNMSRRIDQKTGRFGKFGNSENTYQTALNAKKEDGIFIDVGGYIGDSAIPSAALGINTFVFEPVKSNANLIHMGVMANHCTVSEHITVINALVGNQDKMDEKIYVTDRTDNAAYGKEAATKNVGESENDFEQPVSMVKLDTFFPKGTKIQNLKIDVQGFELQVLKGAKRILTENKGRLRVRFEFDEGLLKKAGTEPNDVLEFMKSCGYEIVEKSKNDLDWK